MVKIDAILRSRLMELGKWSEFVAACVRSEESGTKSRSVIIDDAIDEVCPELVEFKRRKSVKRFEAKTDERAAMVSDSRCNGYRMIEWVVENFERKDVCEYDAPSMAAWSILKASRRDEDTYRDVLKRYIDSKLKLDMASGDTETRRIDGQAEYDLLGNMSAEDLA